MKEKYDEDKKHLKTLYHIILIEFIQYLIFNNKLCIFDRVNNTIRHISFSKNPIRTTITKGTNL